MPASKRCGNCEQFLRSATPGLATWGKCPHREGWVRAHEAPCEQHQGEPSSSLVPVFVALNVVFAFGSLALFVWMDLRRGTLLTHAALASSVAVVVLFAWTAARSSGLGEDAKYVLLEQDESTPDDDRWPPEP
ncbi:MAG: hypothetical protein QM704_16590 [Anaeromyxobacteraceae bacterium]